MLFQCKSQIILVENRERQEIRRNTQAKTLAPTEKKKSRAQLAPTKEGR